MLSALFYLVFFGCRCVSCACSPRGSGWSQADLGQAPSSSTSSLDDTEETRLLASSDSSDTLSGSGLRERALHDSDREEAIEGKRGQKREKRAKGKRRFFVSVSFV